MSVMLESDDRPVVPPTQWQRIRSRIGGHASQSVVALIDQALMSGANFLTVVIVGRAAGVDALGVYSLAYTLLMLVAATQESLVSSPYTFYGHRVSGRNRDELAGSSLVHALGLMLLASIVLALVAWLLGETPLGEVIWVLAAMTPPLLAREFGRKFAFADLRMKVALMLDSTAAVLQIGGLVYLASIGRLNASTAFIVAGVSCAVASAGWLTADRTRFRFRWSEVARHWREHWKFGRWVFAGVVTILLHINIVRWLVAYGIDTSAAGLFAACMAIAMLSSPFIQGMNNVLLPRAAKAFNQSGAAEVRRAVWQTTRWVLVGMAIFLVITLTLGGWIVTQIYGVEYAGNHWTVALLAIFMLSRAVDTSLYNGIWALERPQANVRINVIALTMTVVFASALMFGWGVIGAACGLLVGDLCGTGIRCWTFLNLASEGDVAGAAIPGYPAESNV